MAHDRPAHHPERQPRTEPRKHGRDEFRHTRPNPPPRLQPDFRENINRLGRAGEFEEEPLEQDDHRDDAHSIATNIGALGPAAPRRIAIPFSALRSTSRGVGFAVVLVLAAIDYVRAVCVYRLGESLRQRALWLQRWSRIVLRIIGLQLHHRGTPPCSGMIISKHLSYLDILACSALVPCVFVAKCEVASWPVLGLFARMAGTIFVDRTRRMKVADTTQQIAKALNAGTVVILFAEGTSSDGRTVLPFRSSLLEPAACTAFSASAHRAAIRCLRAARARAGR